MPGFEEDFRKSQFDEDDEFENTQSLRPGKNLNPDRSLNPNHPFAREDKEESSFPKTQFTSLGGTSLLMGAALNSRQNSDSSLTNTENIISEKNSNTIQEKEEDKKKPIIQGLNYIWGTVIGDWNNEQDPIQILANVGVGLIPVADQVLDFRDFIAHLYYMVFKKDYKDPMRWLALGLTAIGAIPFVGSILKGLGKISIFSDASKAIGKSAEPLLEQIKQINPEWGDISKLKAAIDENWEAGVATSFEAWMNLLADVKGKISGVPLPPGLVWGADKLASAKQELLSTITEIQNLSHTMLDEALDKIREEVNKVLDELEISIPGRNNMNIVDQKVLGRWYDRYRPAITDDSKLPAGQGYTDKYGNITVSPNGTKDEQLLVLYHEQIHSMLSPKLEFLREFRADLRLSGYQNSALLRYLEEALAETYAQLRVHGIKNVFEGILLVN